MAHNENALVVLPLEELQSLINKAIRTTVSELLESRGTFAPSKDDKRLTFDEVRVRLRVSRPTLHRLIASGKLPAHKTHERGQWIISERALETYLGGGV